MSDSVLPRARRLWGDLFCERGALVHQVNCTTSYYRGLAWDVYERFPEATPMDPRVPGTCTTVAVSDPAGVVTHVVNVFGQRLPGPPVKGESTADRLAWFEQALDSLARDAKEHGFTQLNFPRGFGAGLARGNWRAYKARIHALAGRVACPIVIVKRRPPMP